MVAGAPVKQEQWAGAATVQIGPDHLVRMKRFCRRGFFYVVPHNQIIGYVAAVGVMM
jgi:hypothetical protein